MRGKKLKACRIAKEITALITVCAVIATGCALSALTSGRLSIGQFIAFVAVSATVGFYGHLMTTWLAIRIKRLKSKNPAPKRHRVRL